MPHKLLLADDSVTIQRVIELTFADEDVQVRAVGDGMKAIASIQSDRPDIVLADVGMPERDGYEVAAFIKGNPQLAHIPVLLLTGAFEPVDETRAREVGCDGVLVKPFEPQMVINRVKDLLAGRRAAPAPAPAAPVPAAAPPAPAPPKDTHGSGGSLEDYFDRLDAAFASLDGGTPAAPAAPGSAGQGIPARTASPMDDFGGWDPDLTAKSAKPEAPPPAPPVVPPPQAHAGPPSAPAPNSPSPLAPVPSAIPQRAAPPSQLEPVPAPAPAPAAAQGVSAPAVPMPTAPLPSLAEAFAALLSAEQSRPITPSTIGAPAPVVSDDVVEEVVRRVIARMGDSVLDAAERLVREEIDRIKRA